jgi:hypothetical protein
MAAEAVVDFIGKDEKLDKTLGSIKGNVEGLSGKLSSALSISLGLFSIEKIKSFSTAILQSTKDADEFKDRFAAIGDSVGELQKSLAGPLYAAIEGLLPAIDAVAEGMAGWGDAISDSIKSTQRFLSGVLTTFTSFGSPSDLFQQGVEEFDRQQQDRVNERKRRLAQNKPVDKNLEAELAAGTVGSKEYFASLDEIEKLQKRSQEIQQQIRDLGINKFKQQLGKLDFSGRTGVEGNIRGIFGDIGQAIGGGQASPVALAEGIGKALGGQLKGLTTGGDTAGFKSTNEDLVGLFNRISGAAASTPELQIAKKTEANTAKQATLQEKATKATENLVGLFKDGAAKFTGVFS